MQKLQKGSKKRTQKPSTAVAPSTAAAVDPYAPQRAVEKQLKRRKVIQDCLKLGITDNPSILAELASRSMAVSEKTMIKDREAVRAEFRAQYSAEATELRDDILAQYDGVMVQLQAIAQTGDTHNVKVSALAQKRETLAAKAKLLGLILDRQEVRGQVTNLNVNAEAANASDLLAFAAAVKKASIDGATLDSLAQSS